MNSFNFKLEFSDLFDSNYIKLIKKNPALFKRIKKSLDLLVQNPKYPSLKSHQVNHPIHGKVWSSWVFGDLRILWSYKDDKIVILLLDIGDHDHVY